MNVRVRRNERTNNALLMSDFLPIIAFLRYLLALNVQPQDLCQVYTSPCIIAFLQRDSRAHVPADMHWTHATENIHVDAVSEWPHFGQTACILNNINIANHMFWWVKGIFWREEATTHVTMLKVVFVIFGERRQKDLVG